LKRDCDALAADIACAICTAPSEYAIAATTHAITTCLNHPPCRHISDRHMLRIACPVLFGRFELARTHQHQF
jgi:hypothetical protein